LSPPPHSPAVIAASNRSANGALACALVGARGLVEHGRPREHIAGDRESVVRTMAAPVDAQRAGVAGAAAALIDQVELAMLAAFVAGDQACDGIGRGNAPLEQVESGRTVTGIDQRLRRQRADAAACVRTQGADGEKAAGNGNAERPIRIPRDDRPGHGSLRARGRGDAKQVNRDRKNRETRRGRRRGHARS
jgi:hypothetical protein